MFFVSFLSLDLYIDLFFQLCSFVFFLSSFLFSKASLEQEVAKNRFGEPSNPLCLEWTDAPRPYWSVARQGSLTGTSHPAEDPSAAPSGSNFSKQTNVNAVRVLAKEAASKAVGRMLQ